MLTIFTIPKSFSGHIGVIQRNAIRSWEALRPACEVILFGDDEGVAETAHEMGLRHIGAMPCTEYGTPFLDAAFARVERESAFPVLCYVNSDIIVPESFVVDLRSVTLPTFLIVGQRIDAEVDWDVDFSDENAVSALWAQAHQHARLHQARGSDYFVYPKGSLGALPPFAVGRPGWDNWMIFRARQLGVPVVDATGLLQVMHQNHSYGHVPAATGGLWEGPEAEGNRSLMAEAGLRFSSRYATWDLTRNGLARRRWWSWDRGVALHTAATLHPWSKPLLPAADYALRVRDRVRRITAASPLFGRRGAHAKG